VLECIFFFITKGDRHDSDHMVVGFTTCYAISAYHCWSSNPAQARCTRYNSMW